MKRTILATAAILAGLAAAQTASATTVIDFSAFEHAGGEVRYEDHFETQGFTFQLDRPSAQAFIVYGQGDGRNADPGHATLMTNILNTTTKVSRTDKGLFDLLSFDMADLFNVGQATAVRLTFTDASGAVTSEVRRLDGVKGLETFTVDRTGLRSFEYAYQAVPQGGSWGQIDNLRVNMSAAPEPAAWALLIVGFGGVGATLRGRRRVALA